ncbi:MAG: ATP-dependent zinc protease [Planctomycetaceae bacterium]
MVAAGDSEDATAPSTLRVSGWREWVGLPTLSIRSIKAKIDSGARSSCLHAFDTEPFERDGSEWVRFAVHPIQRNDEKVIWCEAPVFDRRLVRSSNGVVSQRFVIRTELSLFGSVWPIDLTLHNRDAMGFRMLIGREAVRGRFIIDPGGSYYAGRPKRHRNRDSRNH